MTDRESWTGTATELFEAITPERRPKDWPTTPRGLSGALRRVAQPLEAAGIRLTFSQAGHDKRRIIGLERAGEQPSAPSADRDRSVKQADDGDDPADDGDGWTPPVVADRLQMWAVSVHAGDGADGAVGRSASVLGQEDAQAAAWDPNVTDDDPQPTLWANTPLREPDDAASGAWGTIG
jgi:hypothetical protein